nr:vacuolar protein sorting associated protein 13B [Hymenolepis microstoma]
MQKLFSIETFLSPLLMRYIGKYVKLRDDQFQLSLWGGDAVLNYVELQYDIFEDLMPLPIGFKSGYIHELRIQVPWTRLGSSSIVITLNTVECILAFKQPGESRRPKSEATSMPSTDALNSLPDTPPPPSYLQSYLSRIWSNIEVVVNDLIVKFEEDDAVISLNIRSLDCFPSLYNWERGIENPSIGNYCLHRLLKLTDITLCIDRCDANGRVSAYQDAVIYRYSFDIRLQTVFTQNSSGLASICVANLYNPKLIEINLYPVQIPLIGRLLEILLALSNKILNWDALSDSQVLGRQKSDVKKTNVVDESIDTEPTQSQSWSQWAWSFVPSIPSFSSNPSDEEITDYDLDESTLEYLDGLNAFKARAEYIKLLYEDALSPSSETAKCRRAQLFRLRKHHHLMPVLILGALMKEIKINIKTVHRSNRSPSFPSPSISAKNLRRNEPMQDMLSLTVENLAFQCVQDAGNFTSVQCAFGAIRISPAGEMCPCGRTNVSMNSSPYLLEVKPKMNEFDEKKDSEKLLRTFCGLFESSELNSLLPGFEQEFDARNEIDSSQPILTNSYILPPFYREDYLSRYGSNYPQNRLPLGMWFDIVSCNETENEVIDETYENLITDSVQYSFGRFLLDTVKVNFTLPFSHRIQHFLQILADGSKHYKPCANWDALDVLPPQEPVDSWVLQERMVRLKQFTPISINRAQILSLCVEVFPPTHDRSADLFNSLKIEVDKIEALDSTPLDRDQLIFTMTHLYPSPGVISDVNTSFRKDLVRRDLLESKSWGRRDQISACFGIHVQNSDIEGAESSKNGVFFDFEEGNPITVPLQIDLLNACYTRQLVRISNLRITLGKQTTPILSPFSITLAQRKLIFAESWPKHLVNDIVIRECSVEIHPKMSLNLNAFLVCGLSAYVIFLSSNCRAILTDLSCYLHNGTYSESEGFSTPLSENGLAGFFKSSFEEQSTFLNLDIEGLVSFYSQSGKNKSVVNVTLETSKFTGNLVNSLTGTICPIFDRSPVDPSQFLSINIVKKIVSGFEDIQYPALIFMKANSLKFVLTSTLIEWFKNVTMKLQKSWNAFEDLTTEEFRTDVQSCISVQKLDLQKRSSRSAKSIKLSVPSQNRSSESTCVLVTKSDMVVKRNNSSFSEWIIANYKWFTCCKLEISIAGFTVYLCPINDHYSIDDSNAWFASLSLSNRAKVIQISLPRIEVTGPSTHSLERSQYQPCPPSAPPINEFPGIRLYSFELEAKQREEEKKRMRRILSNSEPETSEILDPNRPKWDFKASGMEISIGMSPSLLFQIWKVESTLAFTISLPKPDADPISIDWGLIIKIISAKNTDSEFSPNLKDVVQFLKITSDIQSEIEVLTTNIRVTKDLISFRTERKESTILNYSNISTPLEVMPCGSEAFESSSMPSHVTTSSLHSLSGSRSTSHRISSLKLLANENSLIPVRGSLKLTFPSITGQLCLNDDRSSAIQWVIEGFSVSTSISHSTSFIHFRTQLERICLLLRTRNRCYPLLSSENCHLRPFQNVTPCPGSDYSEESRVGPGRPKPKSPQEVDSDNELDLTPSRLYEPVSVFKLSLIRCPAGVVRKVFAGKRFTRWLDSESEQFLLGEKFMENGDFSPPFINCIYVRLKPMDVMLCPQLVAHVKDAFEAYSDPDKVTSEYSTKTPLAVVKDPLPGHCMPLVFAAMDGMRIFLPSPGLMSPQAGESAQIDTVALTVGALHLHSFPTNSVTFRPELPGIASTKIVNLKTTIGSPLEDRQFILHFDNFACWAVKLANALNCSDSPHCFNYQPTLARQYPAFEWNQAATRLSDMTDAVWVLPVLRPLSVTAIYAAPVGDNSLVSGQKRLLLGSALEVNISHDIIATLSVSFLKSYLSNLSGALISNSAVRSSKVMQNSERSSRHVSRLLLTCGLIRCVAWERRLNTENEWDFLMGEVIQPHLTWSPEGLNSGINDLRLYLRTFSDETNSKFQGSVLWIPTLPKLSNGETLIIPSCLPLPRIEESSHCHPSDGVCFSTFGNEELFVVNLSRRNSKDGLFEASARIQRNISFVLTPPMLTCLTILSKSFQSSWVSTEPIEDVDRSTFSIPTYVVKSLSKLSFSTRLISIALMAHDDMAKFSVERIELEGSSTSRKDWRSFNSILRVSNITASLGHFQCIPSATGLNLRSSIDTSSVNFPIVSAQVEISRGTRLIFPLGEEIKRLTRAFDCISRYSSSNNYKKESPSQGLPQRQIFIDDLRLKSAYDFSVFVPTGPSGLGDTSRWLPLPFEIVFADFDQFLPEELAEERCATMTWTFPEPRQITRLSVNPVPLVYENDYGNADGIMLPARLQYWNEQIGEYGGFVTYATFELREDSTVDVSLPEILEHQQTIKEVHRHRLIYRPSADENDDICWGSKANLNLRMSNLPIVASTWRIIVSCMGRCSSKANFTGPISVFLSPYALAACTYIDSIYIPELTTSVSIQLRVDDFCFSLWKKTEQTCLETGRLTVSNLRGLLATSFQTDLIPFWGFSLDLAAVHIFDPHGAHLQLLSQVERVHGVSGDISISVGSCCLCCSSTIVYALRGMLNEDGTGWTIRNQIDEQICVEQYFVGGETNEPSAEALKDVTRFALDAGECKPSWRPIVLPKVDSGNRTISLRFKKSTDWSAPISIEWPPINNTRTISYPIKWLSTGEKEEMLGSLFLLIPSRPSSGIPGEVIIQSGFNIENNLPINVYLTLPGVVKKCIESCSSHGICVPLDHFDFSLSAFNTNSAIEISWKELASVKKKILLLPIGEDISPVLLKVNNPSEVIQLITLTPAFTVTNAFPMPITLEVTAKSNVHFVNRASGNCSEHIEIPQKSSKSVMVSFRPGSRPTFNFRYPDLSQVFDFPLSVPLEKASNEIDILVQPWLLLSNHSGINLQIFTADNLEDINYPDGSGLDLSDGLSFIPGTGERLLKLGLHHKGEVVWSPPILIHNSVFAPLQNFTQNDSSIDETVVILTASGTEYQQNRRRSIGQTPADAVVNLTRDQPLSSISLRLGGLICSLALRLSIVGRSPKRFGNGEIVTLSIEPLLQLKNRSNRTLLCKPIAAPNISIQQCLPIASVDELNAEIVTLSSSADEKPLPLLFWNFTHPDVVFEGVDSKGILFAHLLVLRSHLGVFWSRSLQLSEVASSDGIRMFESTGPLRRYYHISLAGYDENGDPNEHSLLLTLSNESRSGIWILYLDNMSTSLSATLGCSLINSTDHSIAASINFHDFHKLPVSNALPCVYPRGGKLTIISQSGLDHLVGMRTPGETSTSDFIHIESTSLSLHFNSDEVTVKLAECDQKPLSLIFSGTTIFIQRVVDQAIPSAINVVIFTEKKPSLHPILPIGWPLSMSIYIDTVLIFAPISGSLLKHGDSRLRNFVRVSVRCIDVSLFRDGCPPVSEFSVTSSMIQIDNLAQLTSSTFDFPVLLRSVLSHANEGNTTGSFSCSGQIRHIQPFGDLLLDKFDLRLPSIEAYLEDSVLFTLLAWIDDLKSAGSQNTETIDNNDRFPTILCLRDLQIHSIALQLALKAKIGVHISCKTTQFRLNKFARSEAVLQVSALIAQISTHYISQVLIRAGIVLGSLELIGNPVSLVASFAEGLSDLVNFSGRENSASREQLSPLIGVTRGLVSLVKHATGGVCSSVTGMASSVAQNLHELSLDTEHIQRTTETRQRHHPTSLGNGLVLGLSEFGVSLLGGLAGIAHHPLFAVVDSTPSMTLSPMLPDAKDTTDASLTSTSIVSTAEALAGGVGRGLVGLVAKPLAGVADLVAYAGNGFMHGMGAGWGITPSPSHLSCPILSPDTVQLVDASLLHGWSCALTRLLGLPQFRDYLWSGLGVDTDESVLTWLCLPYPGSLFAVEFKSMVQAIRAGVIPVGVADAGGEELEEILTKDASNSLIPFLLTQCRLSVGDRTVLKRYFVDYKLNTTISEKADYRVHFLGYVGIASQFPNLIMAAFNTFFQMKSSTSNPTFRFMVVMVLELVILIFTTIMVFVDTTNVPAIFFGLTIASVVLINCCVGIHQTLTFGLAAFLPMKYSNAVIMGSNICGVLVASVNMLVKGLAEVWGESERSIIITRTCYFAVATIYVVVCVLTYIALQRLEFVRYYLNRKSSDNVEEIDANNEATTLVTKIALETAEDNTGEGSVGTCSPRDFVVSHSQCEARDDEDVSAWYTLRNCFALCCFAGSEGRQRCGQYWSRYKETFKECWLQCLTVWMVFACTLALFPSVQSTIRSNDPSYIIKESWFVDVTCFFFFNLFALLGCMVSNWVRFPGPRFLWMPVLLRFIFFVPFFLFSNYHIDGRVGDRWMPLWVTNDHVYVFGSIVFAFTSGYFSSLGMMYAPMRSPPERAGLAGLLASFFLILGVFSGCNLTRALMAFL